MAPSTIQQNELISTSASTQVVLWCVGQTSCLPNFGFETKIRFRNRQIILRSAAELPMNTLKHQFIYCGLRTRMKTADDWEQIPYLFHANQNCPRTNTLCQLHQRGKRKCKFRTTFGELRTLWKQQHKRMKATQNWQKQTAKRFKRKFFGNPLFVWRFPCQPSLRFHNAIFT